MHYTLVKQRANSDICMLSSNEREREWVSDYFPVHGMSSQMKRQTSVGNELNNGKRSEWKIRWYVIEATTNGSIRLRDQIQCQGRMKKRGRFRMFSSQMFSFVSFRSISFSIISIHYYCWYYFNTEVHIKRMKENRLIFAGTVFVCYELYRSELILS